MPRTLRCCVDFLNAQAFTSEIIVVTDGSKDRTAEVAASFADQGVPLKVIAFPFNKGKGFSVRVGMLEAKGRFRMFLDADYAVPIDFALPFLDTAKSGVDVVIASRVHDQAHIEERQKFVRQQLATLFGAIQKVVLRLPVTDTQCGFKMFTAQAAETLFPLMTYDCAFFDTELIYIAHKLGFKVQENPVNWRHDQETRLPIGPKRSVNLFLKLLAIRDIHSDKKPMIRPVTKELERIR